MKKLRIGILLGILVIVGISALYKPQSLQRLVYKIVGEERVPTLLARHDPNRSLPVDANGELVTTTANGLYAELQSKIQLKPDRRFTRAAAQLLAFADSSAAISPRVQWSGSEWLVAIDETTVGSLPIFPNFGAGAGFIESWLDQLEDQNKIQPIPVAAISDERAIAGVDGFNPKHLISSLADLNNQWRAGNQNGIVLHGAAISLTRLSLVSSDKLGFSDVIFARALAMLTLAKRVNRNTDYSEYESQLAFAMGYESEAISIARKLDKSNTWGIYLFQRDQELIAALKTNREAKYYLLRRLAEENLTREWYKFLNRHYSRADAPVHALMTGYELDNWDTFRYLSRIIPLIVVEHGGGTPTWKKLSVKLIPMLPESYGETLEQVFELLAEFLRPGIDDTYRQFNSSLKKNEKLFTGPFLDGGAWRSLQQSLFTTSIYRHGKCTIECYKTSKAGRRFAGALARADSDEAKLLASYFDLLSRAKDSPVNQNEVIDLIDQVKVFGADPMFRLFSEIKNNYRFGAPQIKSMMHKITTVMDSRIDNRYDYANTMHLNLLNLSAARTTFETIVRDKPDSSHSVQLWLARYFGKHEAIVDLIHQDSNTHAEVVTLIDKLKTSKIDELGIDRLFTPLISKYPSSWALRVHYIEGLERAARYDAARQQAQDWSRVRSKKASRYDVLRAKVYIARSYRYESKYQKAKQALQPTLLKNYGWGYYEATEIALAQGKVSAAVDLAEKVRKHFPWSQYSMQNLLKAYWSGGKFNHAAELILAGAPYSDDYWRWTLGKIYAEVFKDNTEAGLKALNALLVTKINHIKFAHLAHMVNEAGNHELSFEISNQLYFPGPGILTYKLNAYKALREWQGEAKALSWLQAEVPKEWVNMSSETIMYQQAYDLLWEFITRPDDGSHPYGVWLIRAAAYVLEGKEEPARYNQLMNYYAAPEHDTYYDSLGRMALGIESGDALLNKESDMLKVGEAAFYKGVQEYGKGNYYLAADWFKTVLETGVMRNAEYRWAQGRLYVWMTRSQEIKLQLTARN